ncbi:TfoX/Sxy family protein [Microbacterium dauci]|uniref:TfoX/Sxy family protein n=1 Tax=Microbacterium dauci TaxID=3048008 RepID=A0ABT6ZDJ6_9MICO|nr:TfoX/Sxy family protein [Microbacterium sp. LX3-4]MDJ1114230.1 TfoX/Sxy family protein [Microbacterium sp. LX3-4]
MAKPSPTTPEVREVVDEARTLIGDRAVREIFMFGALALMVDDSMAVAVFKDESLLVRVRDDEDEALLREPDAARAEMGEGRSMGLGWVRVTLDAEHTRLPFWVAAALRRPGKSAG